MNVLKIMACGLGALAATLWSSLPAHADQQPKRPLSMSYQLLGIDADAAKKPVTVPSSRCSPVTWVASLGACGRALAEDGPEERVGSADSAGGGGAGAVRVAADPAVPRSGTLAPAERPVSAVASETAAVRAASVREPVIGSSRSADLLLRVGPRNRLRSNEESFTDANYQSHVQNNSHKALAVELMVPFQ